MTVDPAFRLVCSGRSPVGASDLDPSAAAQSVVMALAGDDLVRVIECLADLLLSVVKAAVERSEAFPWSPRPRPRGGMPALSTDRGHFAAEARELVRDLAALPSDDRAGTTLIAAARFCHRAAAACGVALDPFLLDAHRSATYGEDRHGAEMLAALAGQAR